MPAGNGFLAASLTSCNVTLAAPSQVCWHAENSEARLGKDVQYKLLVRAINESTNEELAQLVSQGFSVSFLSCLQQHMVLPPYRL